MRVGRFRSSSAFLLSGFEQKVMSVLTVSDYMAVAKDELESLLPEAKNPSVAFVCATFMRDLLYLSSLGPSASQGDVLALSHAGMPFPSLLPEEVKKQMSSVVVPVMDKYLDLRLAQFNALLIQFPVSKDGLVMDRQMQREQEREENDNDEEEDVDHEGNKRVEESAKKKIEDDKARRVAIEQATVSQWMRADELVMVASILSRTMVMVEQNPAPMLRRVRHFFVHRFLGVNEDDLKKNDMSTATTTEQVDHDRPFFLAQRHEVLVAQRLLEHRAYRTLLAVMAREGLREEVAPSMRALSEALRRRRRTRWLWIVAGAWAVAIVWTQTRKPTKD